MNAPCFCRRAPRGFAWHDYSIPAWDRPLGLDACSLACLNIIANRRGLPEMPNKTEELAVDAASERIGAYLEQIGKTDLATMSAEEWHGFLLHAFTCTAEEVRDLVDADVPF